MSDLERYKELQTLLKIVHQWNFKDGNLICQTRNVHEENVFINKTLYDIQRLRRGLKFKQPKYSKIDLFYRKKNKEMAKRMDISTSYVSIRPCLQIGKQPVRRDEHWEFLLENKWVRIGTRAVIEATPIKYDSYIPNLLFYSVKYIEVVRWSNSRKCETKQGILGIFPGMNIRKIRQKIEITHDSIERDMQRKVAKALGC